MDSDRIRIQMQLYGKGFERWCAITGSKKRVSKVCGKDMGLNELQVWDDMQLTEQFHEAHTAHDAAVRACIPPSRLLELNMDAMSDDELQQAVYRFLNCQGAEHDFSEINKDASMVLALSLIVDSLGFLHLPS